MTAPVGPTVFAVFLWGAVGGVLLVFAYELSVLGVEAGWLAAVRRIITK